MRTSSWSLVALFLVHSAWGAPSPVISIESGSVRGTNERGTYVFKGIPYAAPPVGPLRWKAPQPPLSWRASGIRNATEYGHECVQPSSGFDGPATGSEDCLTLNVWSPSRPSREKRPVMVFIHGGFFVRGSSSTQLAGIRVYDGRELSEHGDAVLVTLNYRMGPFGYIAHPELATEAGTPGSGNYGLMDQIAALKWVQRNIAEFGGDPSRVTVFGQSAGAISITALVASPAGRGLFSQAIIQSGAHVDKPLSEAERYGKTIATRTGCDQVARPVLDCMRSKSAAAILAAAPNSFGPGGITYAPNIDGELIPRPTQETFKLGLHNAVPMIIGNTADEATTILPAIHEGEVSSQPVYRQVVESVLGIDAARRALPLYTSERFGGSHSAALVSMIGDATFICPTRNIALSLSVSQPRTVWRYVFTQTSPSRFLRDLGAGHGLDLPFIFRNFSSNLLFRPSRQELSLSDSMADYWTRFARSGDPNAVTQDPSRRRAQPKWPSLTANVDSYFKLGPDLVPAIRPRNVRCDFWDALATAASAAR